MIKPAECRILTEETVTSLVALANDRTSSASISAIMIVSPQQVGPPPRSCLLMLAIQIKRFVSSRKVSLLVVVIEGDIHISLVIKAILIL